MVKKFLNKEEASLLIKNSADEFALVENPDYVHPQFELYPLAAKITSPREELTATVMDMDGTTTTTEELCIHSLEFMIRRMSGKMSKESWEGLNHKTDYPFIIGNSTTKHVEFLVNKYKNILSEKDIKSAFIYAAIWTLILGKDLKRKEEAKLNLVNFNLAGILEDEYFIKLNKAEINFAKEEDNISEYFFSKFHLNFSELGFNALVKIGIEIYYQRYHEILERIRKGESAKVSEEIFNDKDKHLIEPMPGVLIFLALTKGWLGDEANNLSSELIHGYERKSGKRFILSDTQKIQGKLNKLSAYFSKYPVKTGIVTSSIFYEADIVMNAVFKVFTSQIDLLNLSNKRKELLKRKFSSYKNLYDSFVTASDSSEIRLKPHRDLYSIALHQMNIRKDDFSKVIGFEDSESGTIAIRAAGIGLCIAVPFAQTSGHDLSAAAFVCPGGLPEVILMHNLFIRSV